MMATLTAPSLSQETNGALPSPASLFERAVCLSLSLHKPGNRRSVPTSMVEVDADKELISATKTLLDSAELKDIDRCDGEIRRYLKSRCLPSQLKDCVYLLPLPFIEAVEARLSVFADKRGELVAHFVDAYPTLIEEVQTRLRATFDPSDYPPAEVLVAQFQMRWHYVSFSVPGQLQTISRALFYQEQQKAEQQWQEAMEEVRSLLRVNLTKLVDHLIERLRSTTADGKPNVFRQPAITKMTEFLDTFDARNLADDHALAAVVARAREALQGVDAPTVRSSEQLRSTLCRQFTDLKSTLDTLVVTRPARAFYFEEE